MLDPNNWKVENLRGATEVIDWFGRWPSFHDSEVIEIHLSRKGESWLSVHAWNTTKEIDSTGHSVLDKHAVVTFHFSDVRGLDLGEFNHQNVIYGLEIAPIDEGIELTLEPCFGVCGSITAKQISVSFVPGKPT